MSATDLLAESRLADLALAADAKGRGKVQGQTLHAPLLGITRGAEGSLLIVVKPQLVLDAPVDVQQYTRTNDNFPQETTADPFFSEEQWESYCKLGETIGAHLGQAIFSGDAGIPKQAVAQLLNLRSSIQQSDPVERPRS